MVVEEAPAPGMDEATREAVTAAAVAAARAVGYEGAGTVEFIADGSAGLRGDRIWFMEMNTRLQVEHPVTEMATGLDLVEWQLRVADGQDLPLPQEEIRLKRFAMEARLYAENPAKGFLPSTGRLDHLRLPQTSDAVRVDAGVVQGDVVTPFYDPMIAKIIACGPTRDAASRALASACAEVEVWPVKTNAAFLVRCLRHPDFLSGDFDTGFIESRLGALTPLADPPPAVVARGALGLAASASEGESSSPWAFGALPGFRLNAEPVLEARLVFEGRIVTAPWRPQTPAPGGQGEAGIFLAGDDQIVVFDQGQAYALSADLAPGRSLGEARADGRILAPMPGRVVSVGGAVGDVIKKGQTLVVLEAMKMEHSLVAPFDGVLSSLEAASGVQVPEGAVLARLEKQR
jgi:propionyl-CoA carboxylase alpha chain/3-methylcrotonyl-CoA carboxylase alpha subunit